MASSDPSIWGGAFAVDEDELGQYTPALGTLTNAVSFAILVLTMVGAAGMMASMLTKEYTAGKGSTVRSRMVLFLVFGDFWLGLIGVIPTLATLAHHPPREGTAFCNSMGYLLGVSLYVQHLNTLTLCVSTFLILVHPLSLATRLLERHWRWLFPLPWIVSFTLCGIAWGTQGDWGYNNGLCFYKAGLFSEVWQFLPRCIVFTVISVLYVRLFVFLRRPDKIRSSTSLQGGSGSSTTGGQISDVDTGGRRWSRWRFGSRSSFGFRASVAGDHPGRWAGFSTRVLQGRGSDGSDQARSRTERGASAGGPLDVGMRSVAPRPTATETTQFGLESAESSAPSVSAAAGAGRDLPAWEKMELPDYSTNLGSAYSPPMSPKTKRPSTSGWKWGMGASQSFGGVEGADMTRSFDEPVPSKQPRRSTLAPLKIPLPAAPTQPALRRNSSFIHNTPSSRRPSAQGSDSEGDGRLLDFPFASLRRGSHVSFAEHPTPGGQNTPSAARAQTPPVPPAMPQTFGGPEPGLSISSAAGGTGSHAFSGFSFASQGTAGQVPLLPSQAEDAHELSPSTVQRPRFSDGSVGSGIDPTTPAPATPPPLDIPPIVLSQDFVETSSGEGSSSAANTSETRRDSAATTSDKGPDFKRPLSHFAEEGISPGVCEDGLAKAGSRDGDDESDGEEYSLARILEMSAPPADYDYFGDGRGMSVATRGQGSSGEAGSGSGTGSGSDGKNQESMSKFMNRKASLLMLTFPLAYVVLFSVSLVRIIYDFVHPEPVPALSAVSRWLVFSQGLVDALIYGIIEWKVKRTVRRRTKKLQSASHEDSRGNMTGVNGSFGGTTNRASHSTAGKHRSSRGISSLP